MCFRFITDVVPLGIVGPLHVKEQSGLQSAEQVIGPTLVFVSVTV